MINEQIIIVDAYAPTMAKIMAVGTVSDITDADLAVKVYALAERDDHAFKNAFDENNASLYSPLDNSSGKDLANYVKAEKSADEQKTKKTMSAIKNGLINLFVLGDLSGDANDYDMDMIAMFGHNTSLTLTINGREATFCANSGGWVVEDENGDEEIHAYDRETGLPA